MKKLKAVFLDLDGTVYAGDDEVPGASDFVRFCTARGIRCLFITNRSNRAPEAVCDQLAGYGIPCHRGDVITTATATAAYIKRAAGTSAYVIGGSGLVHALEEQGIVVTDNITVSDGAPGYVVAGIDLEFTYDKLAKACRFISEGAAFIATNADARLKLKDRVVPGAGAIIQAIATGSGKQPVVIGKPEPLLFRTALEMHGLAPREVLAIGDNIDTDIPAGFNAGIDTVLLLTGVSTRQDAAASAIKPTHICADFAELTKLISK